MSSDIISRDIRFNAADGYELAGRLNIAPSPHMAVLVSSGTGYPKGFYDRLAKYMAERGAVVLTYDYRGIGDSAPDNLKGSQIDYPDWGRLDQTAALERLKREAPTLPVYHVAHSIGGSFVGFMSNHAEIKRHAFLSVGSGYWPHHLRSYNPVELFFWFGFGPVHLLQHGYIKQGKLWPGNSLPRKVFTTWRRWCMKPGFFNKELQSGRLEPQHYADVTTPIRSWLFTDDPIATPRAARTIAAALPNAPIDTVLKSPADYGRQRIGHEGSLRKGMEPLWQEILDWFDEELPAA